MAIEAGIIDNATFQKYRTRDGKDSQYADFLTYALNMQDGTAAKLSHTFTFTNDQGVDETVTAEHSDKGSCPISAYVMNQRGRLGLRKGMFRSAHAEDGDLLLYRTLISEVKNADDSEEERVPLTEEEAEAEVAKLDENNDDEVVSE